MKKLQFLWNGGRILKAEWLKLLPSEAPVKLHWSSSEAPVKLQWNSSDAPVESLAEKKKQIAQSLEDLQFL